MIATGIAIRDYEPSDQPYFEKFNRAWIEKDFWMEPVDIDVLTKPETHILSHGGRILMATFGGEIAGTVALKYVDDKTYEFTKMAVDDRFRGKKIGLLLTTEALKLATRLGATASSSIRAPNWLRHLPSTERSDSGTCPWMALIKEAMSKWKS